MVSAQGQPRHWAVDGEQLFSSAALVFLVFWGCKMGYAFGEQDPKERESLFFMLWLCSLAACDAPQDLAQL